MFTYLIFLVIRYVGQKTELAWNESSHGMSINEI